MDVWADSLSTSIFIWVPVSSQENERSSICVLGESILPVSTIFLLDFGTVPTVRYFFSFLLKKLCE